MGCFKDEVAGREIEEMILLRPKMYSIKIKGQDAGIKRAKGIGRYVVRNMRHADYQQAYHQHRESTVNMTILKSISHTIHTVTFNKRGLSCWEDKRVWLSANVSVPHGSVDSPVPAPPPKNVLPPPSGDVDRVAVLNRQVESDGDDVVEVDERGVAVRLNKRNKNVIESDDDDVVEVDERGEAVGFDGEDDEEECESETEQDRQFIDDDEMNDEECVAPLRRRLMLSDDDEIFDVAALAKRCRFS